MGHRLADVHLAGFAPAFTLSLCDSEYARKPPVPIASVVRGKRKKKEKNTINSTNNNFKTTIMRTYEFEDDNQQQTQQDNDRYQNDTSGIEIKSL